MVLMKCECGATASIPDEAVNVKQGLLCPACGNACSLDLVVGISTAIKAQSDRMKLYLIPDKYDSN